MFENPNKACNDTNNITKPIIMVSFSPKASKMKKVSATLLSAVMLISSTQAIFILVLSSLF